jgi:SAM-dependent methyltransferase
VNLLVPARRFDSEWIDRRDNDPSALSAALGDIHVVNRLLGGERVLLRGLDPLLAGIPRGGVLEVLDVGTGCGDLPLAMARWGRRRGRRVRVTAVDIDPTTTREAARFTAGEREIRVVQADAFALPFGSARFDVVTSSMFLHHFRHEEIVRLLRSFRHLARRAVVVNDLRRHVLPWAFILLAAKATRRHPMFVHDAPLSVLRGFTDVELLTAAEEACGAPAVLERRWPYRLVLTMPGSEAA